MDSSIDVEIPFQVLTQLASNASKPVNKYAALRVMNRIATRQPNLVGICQAEIEALITDMNRSVASLAISTLLKTCNEDSVQKLLKQISHYLPDLGLDFKIETIQSTALLYHRLPTKADVLLKFLTDCLKEESNIQFRESVVDTIIEICPSQRENALMILAEHIEDCEHSNIQTKIINFLAEEGPKAKNPSSYIRFIYNRVNLEKAVIRAASVTALATFAHKVPYLKASILLLL
jgi:coatomer subunit gamma